MAADIYAIGDIHGNLDLLQRLLDKIQPDLARDQLVFMGDYIDRGPTPKGVVDYVLDLKRQAQPQEVICLKGNHEAMFLNFLQGRELELFLYNGGISTLRDYWGEHGSACRSWSCPRSTVNFSRGCASIMRPGLPLRPRRPQTRNSPGGAGWEDLLWIRGDFIASLEDFGKKVIFGHTPFQQPLVMPNKIGIDTGAAYGNRLTCLKLPREQFISVGHDSGG